MPTVSTPRVLSEPESEYFDEFSDDDQSMAAEGELVYADVDPDVVVSYTLLKPTDYRMLYKGDRVCGHDAKSCQ